MIAQSTIICPECGVARLETMPTDTCQYFYECTGCGCLLHPEPGDCCVFCSYGSVPCPPKQSEGAAQAMADSAAAVDYKRGAMSPPRFNDPSYWRRRAQEARAQAEAMPDPLAKQTLLGIAVNYDQLAEQAEVTLGSHAPPLGDAASRRSKTSPPRRRS